jgi:hypothetical protein
VQSVPPPLKLTYPSNNATRRRANTHEDWRPTRSRRLSTARRLHSGSASIPAIAVPDTLSDDEDEPVTPVLRRRLNSLLQQRNSAPAQHDFSLRSWRRSHRHGRSSPEPTADMPMAQQVQMLRQRHEELAGGDLDLSEVDVPDDLDEAAKVGVVSVHACVSLCQSLSVSVSLRPVPVFARGTCTITVALFLMCLC